MRDMRKPYPGTQTNEVACLWPLVRRSPEMVFVVILRERFVAFSSMMSQSSLARKN